MIILISHLYRSMDIRSRSREHTAHKAVEIRSRSREHTAHTAVEIHSRSPVHTQMEIFSHNRKCRMLTEM